MLTKNMISNGTSLLKYYCPHLFDFITEKDFESFLINSYNFTNQHSDGTSLNNFSITFLELAKEHSLNHSTEIRNEFKYFNFILGEFLKINNPKKFKDLIKGSLFNQQYNNFKHALGEAAACLDLSQQFTFIKYETKMENGKEIDLHFQDKLGDLYVEVYTIEVNKEKYENHNFQSFLNERLLKKFKDKTDNLRNEYKERTIIYPLLDGVTVDIIKEQEEYLKSLVSYNLANHEFQSFEPRCFGNIQGTFFNLFSIDQIANPQKYYK